MRRILFIFPYLNQGGAQKVATTLAKHLSNKWEYKFDFFTLDDQFFYRNILSSHIRHFFSSDKNTTSHGISSWRLYKGLVRHLKIYEYDILISGCEGTSEISLFLLRHLYPHLCRNQQFITLVHTPISKIYDFSSEIHKLGWNLLKWMREKSFDQTVTVSKSLFNDPFLGEIKTKRVINNPIDLDELNYLSNQPFELIHQNIIKVPFFLYVGRISSEKNPLLLLEGFNLIKNDCPHNLVMLGAVNDLALLKRIQVFIEQNLKGRVFSLGAVTNPYCFMAKADALVVTSNYESFSLVAFEAMSLGCPIILTKFAGYEELFSNENTLLIGVNDVNDLVIALNRIIHKDSSISSIKKKAKELSQIYDLSIIANQYHNLFMKE